MRIGFQAEEVEWTGMVGDATAGTNFVRMNGRRKNLVPIVTPAT